MAKIIRLWIVGFVIQLVGLAGFLAVAPTAVSEPEKQAPIILFCIATFILLVVAVYQLDLKKLIVLAGLLALSLICTYQTLGFTRFPGLVKDIELFSAEHLTGLAEVMAILFGAYTLTILSIWIIGKLLKLLIPDRVVSGFWSHYHELWDIW